MLKLTAAAALAALAAGTVPALAADDPAEPSRWNLGVALGYGERSNPLIQSEDIPVVVDVDIAWFGDRFFFDNGDVGATLADNDWLTVNLIGRFNSDRVFFGKTDTRIVRVGAGTGGTFIEVQVEVPDRDYAVEAGIEVLTDGRWGRLQLATFHDVSGTHDGYQVNADYSIGFRSERFYLEPSVGLSYKSQRLNDYYWGVGPDEAGLALSGYRAGAGTNASLRLLGSYQISRHWSFAAVAEYERLGDEIARSPIVRDDRVTAFFAGFGYRF